MQAPTPTVAINPSERIAWIRSLPFIGMHVACLGALWTGVSWSAFALCVALYAIRMFGITGIYHRYFSHRSYKTSRWFQFVLAFFAQTSAQRGVLWWAAHHRAHHLYSDQEGDLHSVRQDGFWHSHVMWIFDHNSETDTKRIQ